MEQNHNGASKSCSEGGTGWLPVLLVFLKYCHIQHSSSEEFKKEISSRWCLLKLILSSRDFLLSSSFNQDMDMAYLIKMGLQDFPFLYRQRDKKKESNKPAHHMWCIKTTSYILNFKKKGSLLKKTSRMSSPSFVCGFSYLKKSTLKTGTLK